MSTRHVRFRAVVLGLAFAASATAAKPDPDIAQTWIMLTARALWTAGYGPLDNLGPTSEARTLYHVSAVMYDSWAAYDPVASGVFTGTDLQQPAERNTFENVAETLSHAVYGVLVYEMREFAQVDAQFNERQAWEDIEREMRSYGYVTRGGKPKPSEAQALGQRIAEAILAHVAQDGSNEAGRFADTTGYRPRNPVLIAYEPGAHGMLDPNHWQPMIGENQFLEPYCMPHWGQVTPFAIGPYTPGKLRLPPPPPPLYGTASEAAFIENMVETLRVSSWLDPGVGRGAEKINLSPGASRTIVPNLYETSALAVNPHTGNPYKDHSVRLGDYLRALALYHDGHVFQTPAPWWNEVATCILAGEGIVDAPVENKTDENDLGYDVKLYFALNAALHDTAIAIWDVKRTYDTCRPISGIRYLAEQRKLPLEPGFIEMIEEGDSITKMAGGEAGGYKVMAWGGQEKGVKWIPATMWHPYQDEDFVTPDFPGYTSGHSAFGMAAAEVLAAHTGDEYFPGGLATLEIDELRLEEDFHARVILQWATYRDMAVEAGFARVANGVHIPADSIASRAIGAKTGQMALAKASLYFSGQMAAN